MIKITTPSRIGSRFHIHALMVALALIFWGCSPADSEPPPPTADNRLNGTLDGVRYVTLGNPEDVSPPDIRPGICLMGGGPDNDEALRWMISRGSGGDFVVIRSSGGDGYNEYIYRDLGGVDSVTTLIIDSVSGANSQAVADLIMKAEILFIAGGDQSQYDQLWRGSAVEAALNQLLHVKKIPLGGSSAGMAILGGLCYIPQRQAVNSAEALANPYHPGMETVKPGWLHPPWLDKVITETHFSERNRMGRTLAFMARIIKDYSQSFTTVRAIACDEGTALCIDENDMAQVFGRHPQRKDFAFFFSCLSPPDLCHPGIPLNWPQGVRVERIAGTENGDYRFDLRTWLGLAVSSTHTIGVDNGSVSEDIQTPD